jgi:hypothetical protein
MASERRACFPLGEVSTTLSALERLHALGLKPSDLLARHQAGDWGDVGDRDRAMNEESFHEEQRFFSSYDIEEERFWVLTAADRSRTWVLTTANPSSTMVFFPGDEPPGPPPADPYQQGAKTRSSIRSKPERIPRAGP